MRPRFRKCAGIKASFEHSPSLIQFIILCVSFIYLAPGCIPLRGVAVEINRVFEEHRSETEAGPQYPHHKPNITSHIPHYNIHNSV